MASILLIDDNSSFRCLLRLRLEEAGYQVFEAGDGVEGLRLYRERAVDLVLCDLFMPVKEGLETIREMRQAGAVKIIAMSGGPAGPSGFLRIARKLGADGALTKPFDFETLFTTMQQVLGPPA